ncbi:MAG TPA: choice-of-anchor D domain-containing protein [Acidobacteriaceae bacterium]|nr:choice-of-anchor D domain-containing protein [Acidobacteriaceae bacterium]
MAFAPSTSGTLSGTWSITSSASSTPLTVALSGTGGAVIVSPTSLSWNKVAVGNQSGLKTVTLTNSGSAAITINSIGITGTNPADFGVRSNTCGTTVAASASCTATIVFKPTTSGTRTATLNFNDSDSASPQQVSLTGLGTAPAGVVSATPGSLSFGTTNVGSTSTAQIITVTNNTASSVTLNTAVLSDPTDFSVLSTTCGSTLGVSASCTTNIAFTPANSGTLSGTWSITSSASATPLTVNLTGIAAPGGIATLSPSSYDFPTQGAGTVSPPVAFTLTNQSGTLNITNISISNTGFTQSNNCGSSLAAGASCTISVQFAPPTASAQSATLSVVDGANNSPQTASLTGNDTTATLKVKPQNLAYGPQLLGRPSNPQIVTVTNGTGNPVTISSIMESGSAFTQTNTCIPSGSSTGSLGPYASCSISVIFTPSTAGSLTGSVTVTTSSPNGAVAIPLAGMGEVGDTAPSMIITPQGSCILPGQSQQFAAAFRNTSNTAANWYVNSVKGGNSSYGTISASGLYLAPLSTGNFTVEGIDTADSLSQTTSINVTNTPTFAIYPYTASIPPGGQQTFQGQLCSAPDNDVITYSVDNIQGGNATVGTVTNGGVYTAPATAGTHIVRATDTTLNKGSGAVVTVFSSIAVDFGSRTNQKYPISAGILGVNHVDGLHNPADMGLIAQAGVTLSRTYANIQTVYATQTPDWTKIDPLISKLQSQGMHVLMEVALTPPWLQPNPNPCGTAAVPTDINAWAQIAASYVAHMDANFPGVVTDYEIENEPNANGLCGNSDKLSVYLQLYAAAAPLMKQQAATDGTTIRVGGPTTAGLQTSWISALLTNPSTAPYVDFVSYHDYLFGTSGVDAAWDTYNGYDSVYDVTQTAESNRYSQAASVVAAGSQPGGATTPIYIDEYNLNSAFIQNCCQNDPTYAPIWNALWVSDVLDQVYYRGTAAVPQQLTYFAGNAYPYFCMIGTWDAQMDCQYTTNTTPVPYPQYYAYQLMASSSYLGLNSGGYMAASVSPGYTAGGIQTTAFYTANQDSILIVNPTSTAYPSITVTINDSGFSTPTANLFEIVNGNTISSSAITLTPSGSQYTTTLSVPAYTVLGISIQGP